MKRGKPPKSVGMGGVGNRIYKRPESKIDFQSTRSPRISARIQPPFHISARNSRERESSDAAKEAVRRNGLMDKAYLYKERKVNGLG